MPNEKDWIAEIEVGNVQFAFMRDGSIKVGGRYSNTSCSVDELNAVVSIHRLLNGGANKLISKTDEAHLANLNQTLMDR